MPTTSAILFCFAHPDDESFSGAGTAMKYGAAGTRIVLVTATLGEHGKAGDPPVCEPGELGRCRERELNDAAAIIGFDELHILRHRDRELADVEVDTIRRSLVALIRRVRPSVVITFDPHGFNLHPDHIAISRFTSDAIGVAADPRWRSTDDAKPHTVPRLLWTPPGADFVVDVSAWTERRIAALRAHRSQHLSVDKYFLSQPDPRRVVSREIWRQGYGPAISHRPAADIFEGL
jgi:LmbE family N-acetylglucosaminyl deacetylase